MYKKFLILFLYIVFSNAAFAAKDINRMAVIDTGHDLCTTLKKDNCALNKNILIRGNLPAFSRYSTHSFDDYRKELLVTLNQFAKNHPDKSFPKTLAELKEYRIVVVSLLYGDIDRYRDESPWLLNEFKLAPASLNETKLPLAKKMYGLLDTFNDKQIAFIWIPIALTYPNFYAAYIQNNFSHSSYLDVEHLEFYVSQMQSLMLTIPADKHPLLIYYHCAAGKDRTGAATIAYYLQYGGYTVKKNHKPIRLAAMHYQKAAAATAAIGDAPNLRARFLAERYCKHHFASSYCGVGLSDRLFFMWKTLWKPDVD